MLPFLASHSLNLGQSFWLCPFAWQNLQWGLPTKELELEATAPELVLRNLLLVLLLFSPFLFLELVVIVRWTASNHYEAHKKNIRDFHLKTLKLMSHVSHFHYVFTNTASSFRVSIKLFASALDDPLKWSSKDLR